MPDRAATRSWPPVPAAVNFGPGVNGDKIFYKLISPRTSPDDWNPARPRDDWFIYSFMGIFGACNFSSRYFPCCTWSKNATFPHTFHTDNSVFSYFGGEENWSWRSLEENWDQVKISRYSKHQLWMGTTTSDSAALIFISTMTMDNVFDNISLERATLSVVLLLIFGLFAI